MSKNRIYIYILYCFFYLNHNLCCVFLLLAAKLCDRPCCCSIATEAPVLSASWWEVSLEASEAPARNDQLRSGELAKSK